MLWAVEKGITAGVAPDRFAPEQTGTRAQALTFLYGALEPPEVQLPADKPLFEDVPNTAYYAAPVAWAYEKGLLPAASGSTFGPGDPCTKAQIIHVLYLSFQE